MQGINFIVDDKQQQVAVVIDLKQYGELWEDFYASLSITFGAERRVLHGFTHTDSISLSKPTGI